MKKIAILCLFLVFLFTIPMAAMGLNSPSVSQGHGAITGTFVTNDGLVVGAEFGLTSDIAIYGSAGFGTAGGTRIGGKYEINPTLAITGGVIGLSPANPFLGINAAAGLAKNLAALGEIDFALSGNSFLFMYEAGLKYNLNKQLDLRGGVIGSISSGSSVNFELGIGYKF